MRNDSRDSILYLLKIRGEKGEHRIGKRYHVVLLWTVIVWLPIYDILAFSAVMLRKGFATNRAH